MNRIAPFGANLVVSLIVAKMSQMEIHRNNNNSVHAAGCHVESARYDDERRDW